MLIFDQDHDRDYDLFITFSRKLGNPNSTNALKLRDASMKCLETDLFNKFSLRCRRDWSMDWKPNAHTEPGLWIEPGSIDA